MHSLYAALLEAGCPPEKAEAAARELHEYFCTVHASSAMILNQLRRQRRLAVLILAAQLTLLPLVSALAVLAAWRFSGL